jgi:hypothetical protein
MSLTIQQVNALYKLYPQVTVIRGDVAYDADENEVTYDLNAVVTKTQQDACKQQASDLLYATDWTTIPDITNTANNPYLTNQAEFIAYRNEVRKLAVNPVVNPTFPTVPTAQWSA